MGAPLELYGSTPPTVVDDLADLVEDDQKGLIDNALGLVREHLGVDISYVSRFEDGYQIFEKIEGDATSFGVAPGMGISLDQSYCRRMVDGRIPNLIAHAASDERVKDLPPTRELEIGTYVGVPLRLSNGELYGSFCCLTHSSDVEVDERDVNLMRVVARLIAAEIEGRQTTQKIARLRTQTATVRALAAAIVARDGYTGEHTEAVVGLAQRVAAEMQLDAQTQAEVAQVALLHDVGKVGVPDAILRKEGRLTAAEWGVMKTHTEIGEEIVASIPELTHLGRAIRHEHERWDGTGYPDGLRGDQIPLPSQIVLVCDAYHAMTSDRPYRSALGQTQALSELIHHAGSQFAPAVVEAFLRLSLERTGSAPAATEERPVLRSVDTS